MNHGIQDLYKQYGPLVFRRCLAVLKNEELAYDALQEVFLKLLTRPELLKGIQSPVTYLYSMATNFSLNVMKKNRRVLLEWEENWSAEKVSADDMILTKLFLEKLFFKLSDRVRTIVFLRYIDRLGLEEIAQQSQLSLSGVRKNLQKFQTIAQKYKEHIL